MQIQVLMPTFNASAYFAEALESIAGNPNSEILVIDDGSLDQERDAVAAISSRYRDVRFFSRPHRGLVQTANFGLSIATAPFVARMDADDISLAGRLDHQLAFLIANPDVAAVGAQVEYVDAQGKSTGKVSNFPGDPEQLAKHLFNKGCCINHPTFLARRQSLVDIGGYREIAEYAEDYDLWLRLSEQSRLANLPEVVLRYRRHAGQISVLSKWRQRFARDLALISARARRRGEADPAAGLEKMLDLKLDSTRLPLELQSHLDAYKAIDKILEARWNDLSKTDIRLLIDAASRGLLGDDRKIRASIMCVVSRLALKSKYAHEFYAAIRYALSHRPLWIFEAFANPEKSLDRLSSL